TSSTHARPAPITVSYSASRTIPGKCSQSCPCAAFLPALPLALFLMAASSSTQPDLPIGRGLPPLKSQQPSGHRQMSQWVAATQNQGELPPGTKITMSNWQQYKAFMPFGMQKL